MEKPSVHEKNLHCSSVRSISHRPSSKRAVARSDPVLGRLRHRHSRPMDCVQRLRRRYARFHGPVRLRLQHQSLCRQRRDQFYPIGTQFDQRNDPRRETHRQQGRERRHRRGQSVSRRNDVQQQLRAPGRYVDQLQRSGVWRSGFDRVRYLWHQPCGRQSQLD